MIVQHDRNILTAFEASASLPASDYLRRFGPGLTGETLILAQRKSTKWEVELVMLGWKLNSHTGRVSLHTAKITSPLRTLDGWPDIYLL